MESAVLVCSDELWNCFSEAVLGKLVRNRVKEIIMGFSEHVDTILNWTEIQTRNRFRRTLIYYDADTQSAHFWGSPLRQATKQHWTVKRWKRRWERKQLIFFWLLLCCPLLGKSILCRLCVCVMINKRSFESFKCSDLGFRTLALILVSDFVTELNLLV